MRRSSGFPSGVGNTVVNRVVLVGDDDPVRLAAVMEDDGDRCPSSLALVFRTRLKTAGHLASQGPPDLAVLVEPGDGLFCRVVRAEVVPRAPAFLQGTPAEVSQVIYVQSDG